jgi:enamine deaminase RidA (YjgF/YER057c/UK114 family)
MQRRYSWPDGDWNWPVDLTHKHGVRAGDFIFTGGQADLDTSGAVQHPDDLPAQVDSVFSYLTDVLLDLGADANDLVRLVVYFVGDAAAESLILDRLAARIGPDVRPVVNTISLPQLCYPGMMIELEGVAMRAVNGDRLPREHFHLPDLPQLAQAYSHVLRCGDVIFTSDISALNAEGAVVHPHDLIAQTTLMMDQLGLALGAAGADCDDVLKLNVFYAGDGTAQNWEKPALIRAGYFASPGPAATGISVSGFEREGLMSKIAVTAMCANNGERCARSFSWPDGHWDWTAKLPYQHGNRCGQLIHLGGQVSLDSQAQVINPGDIVAQTQTAMDNIARVLAEFGATLDDVVKVTTFYQGEASADELHRNLLIRSGSYRDPGPATSGIPVPTLVYEDMLIEIEVIAVTDRLPTG